MQAAVLIVASTRAHADVQEILRIQDTVSALHTEGYTVDLLVPSVSPLLSAALAPGVHIYTIPRFALCRNPPSRASLRRFFMAVLMVFRGVALVSRNGYAVLHGLNDGALVVRTVARLALGTRACIAEFHVPFAFPGLRRGLRTCIARALERRAFRQADAVILPDAETLSYFSSKLPRARVSLIPDPHAEISPDAFTVGEFNTALTHVYEYVLRFRSKD